MDMVKICQGDAIALPWQRQPTAMAQSWVRNDAVLWCRHGANHGGDRGYTMAAMAVTMVRHDAPVAAP